MGRNYPPSPCARRRVGQGPRLFVEYGPLSLPLQAPPFMPISPPISAQTTHTVCAVVVTYNPCIDKLQTLLKSLDASAYPFMVIDNHSSNRAEFTPWVQSLTGCVELLSMPTNLGQAAAINESLQRLQTRGYQLALLFDQDSAVDASFVSRMLEAWQAAQGLAPRQVAALGPRLVDPRNGQRMPFRLFNRLFERHETPVSREPSLYETAFLITSGCIISLDAVQKAGAMRTDYFIDNVDLEWCFRVKGKGYRLFGTDHAQMSHQIGEDSDSFWVRNGFVVQHSALRYYYSSRNRLHLHKQSYSPWVWRVKDMVRFAAKTLYLLALSPARKEYWRQLKKAVHDTQSLP